MCFKLSRIKTLTKLLTVYKVIVPSPLGGYFTPYTQVKLPSQLEGYKLKAEGALLLQNGNYIGKGIIHAYSTLTQAKNSMVCRFIPYPYAYEIWRCTIDKNELVYLSDTGDNIGARAITFNKRIIHTDENTLEKNDLMFFLSRDSAIHV